MVRLTRAEQQERNRAAVLAAARDEFAERGYADAKIDRIAERAELTRGAVYSNFPSKRALYLAVLLDALEPRRPDTQPIPDLADALGEFARNWLERLPLTGDTPAGGHLRLRSLAGVFDDEPGRVTLAQVTKLEAILLGLALESGGGARRVRLAELVLTLLNGAGHLAEKAPGFGDPFDVTRACQHLAGLDLADTWDPPHLPFVKKAQAVTEEWTPPAPLPDLITGQPVEFGGDGVLVVLGTNRLAAVEEAVRVTNDVTVVVVTSDHAELGRLVRLRVRDLTGCLRPPSGWPRIVLDERGAVAAATGVRDDDDTEAAVRVHGGEIVARANGRGAGHAVTTSTATIPS
jgi:AcrR family transcriptional regulator